MKLPVVSGGDAVKAVRKVGYEFDEQLSLVVFGSLRLGCVLGVVKGPEASSGPPSSVGCRTVLGAGIAAYLENGGTLESAAMICGTRINRISHEFFNAPPESGLRLFRCCAERRAVSRPRFPPHPH